VKIKKIWFLAVLTVVAFQLLFLATRQEEEGWGRSWRNLGIPFYRGGAFLQRILREGVKIFTEKRALIEENHRLWEQLGALESENALLREEVEKLRGELGASKVEKEIGFEVIPAQVVGRDPYDWLGKAIIDKGFEHGVEKDLVVVTYQGMVGKVETVYSDYSVVRLLLSPAIAVGVLAQRTRDLGVVSGEGSGLCTMRYIYRTSAIKEGDVVVTSGLGSKTPRGIVIGRIITVEEEEGGLFKEAVIQPSCDFSLLEKVLVIKGGW